MNSTENKTKFKIHYFLLFLVWVLYAGLSLASPMDGSSGRLGISEPMLLLIKASIAVPFLAIWLTGFYGSLNFRGYSRSIAGSPEGPGYAKISQGLWLLVLSLILPSFIGFISAYNPGVTDVQKITAKVSNYVTLALHLAAFVLIWKGSAFLKQSLPSPVQGKQYLRLLLLLVVAGLFIYYAASVFQNAYRTVSTNANIRPTYFLNDILIVLTIIIPYGIAWFMATQALLNLRAYAAQVEGTVYKKAFHYIAWGLANIIALSIFLQFFSQISHSLVGSSIMAVLLVVYTILLFMILGYALVARGAKELTKIETIQ
jgi:hypothetical protein